MLSKEIRTRNRKRKKQHLSVGAFGCIAPGHSSAILQLFRRVCVCSFVLYRPQNLHGPRFRLFWWCVVLCVVQALQHVTLMRIRGFRVFEGVSLNLSTACLQRPLVCCRCSIQALAVGTPMVHNVHANQNAQKKMTSMMLAMAIKTSLSSCSQQTSNMNMRHVGG